MNAENKDAPMTQGQYHKLHALLLKMRSENENNSNELRDDIREMKGDIRQVKDDVETIADNTRVKLKIKAS